jgi:uncharacterized protein YaiI (UPF0178 family)
MLIVDVSNVLGSRPDGWWRDRAGFTARLVEQVADRHPGAVCVLDTGPTPDIEGVDVVVAERRGRDAADDAIVELLSGLEDRSGVVVVTSDAGLAERVRALGAQVRGAGAFRRELD